MYTIFKKITSADNASDFQDDQEKKELVRNQAFQGQPDEQINRQPCSGTEGKHGDEHTVHALGQTAMLGDRGQARGRTYCTCSGTDRHALGTDRHTQLHAQGKTGIQRDADVQTGIQRDRTCTLHMNRYE
jgi:hypothetical protein